MAVIQRTNRIRRRSGGGWVNVGRIYRRSGGGWVEINALVKRQSGSWVYLYSTLDVSCSGGGAASMGGASASGQTYVYAAANISGSNSGSVSYSWANIGGNAIQCSNTGIANPYFYYNFSGVPNGTTSGPVSATFRCTVTDGISGAQSYSDVTIGNLTWQNTIPAFAGRTDFITSSQSVATPTGANSLTAYIVGGGAQGGAGFNDGMGTEYIGGGASGAGQCVKTVSGPSGSYSCTVASAGFGPSQGGTSSVSGSGISASASGGYPGDNAGSGGYGGGATSVGTCSGGDAHYNGNEGFNGAQAGSGGLAGANGGPYDGDYWGYGGNGGLPFSGGQSGKQGIIVLVWSP